MAETTAKLPVKTDKSRATAEREWTPFDSMRREIDRLFEDFTPFGWRAPLRRPASDVDGPMTPRRWAVNPAFDLVEKDKEYEITAELPGLDEKSIEVKLNDHQLTIRGEKSEAREDKEKDYYLSERRYGSFQRSFQLPDTVDTGAIDASFSKGVLTVRLPKSAAARKAEKTISVKAA